MAHGKRRLALAAVVLVLVAGALVPRLLSSGSGATSRGRPDPSSAPPLPVEVAVLEPQRLTEQLAASGTVRADEEVELVSEISGKVVSIEFREGSRVQQGQLLLKIDDSELVAERDRAAHRVELAERREARQRSLLDEGLVSQQEYDFALSELNVLRAELQLSEAQLVKTELRAPFSGQIGLRDVSVGTFLTSQRRIATLQKINPVKVDFSIPEKYAGHVRIGDEVVFRTRGAELEYRGTILAIEPRVDLDTRSLMLRARSPNPDGSLVPGAFADVEIDVRTIEDALAIPARAVIPELGGKKVYVLEAGEAHERIVETGMRTEDLLQITSGLEPGERVIVSAIQRLRPGLKVEEQEP